MSTLATCEGAWLGANTPQESSSEGWTNNSMVLTEGGTNSHCFLCVTLIFSSFIKMKFGLMSHNSETMGESLQVSAPLWPLLGSPTSVFTGCSNPLLWSNSTSTRRCRLVHGFVCDTLTDLPRLSLATPPAVPHTCSYPILRSTWTPLRISK